LSKDQDNKYTGEISKEAEVDEQIEENVAPNDVSLHLLVHNSPITFLNLIISSNKIGSFIELSAVITLRVIYFYNRALGGSTNNIVPSFRSASST